MKSPARDQDELKRSRTFTVEIKVTLPRTPITPPTIPPDIVPFTSSVLPLYCKT